MTCRRCKSRYDASRQKACPECGEPRPRTRPVFLKTSSILIATASERGLYRSLEEVPAALRSRLLKSTNGLNSATILIADRKGREEIARAVRRMPGAKSALVRSLYGGTPAEAQKSYVLPMRIACAVILVMMAMLFLWAVLARSGL